MRPTAMPHPAGLVLLAVALVSLAVSVGLEVHVARAGGTTAAAESVAQNGIGSAVTGVVLNLLAAVVLRRRELGGFGLALAAFGVIWALDGVAESWLRVGFVTDHPLAGMTLAAWFLQRFTALLPATVIVLPLLFPTGRFLPGLWGLAGRLALGLAALSALSWVVIPSGSRDPALPPGADPDPTTIRSLATVSEALVGSFLVLTVTAALVAAATVVLRYRAARGVDRDRMRWLLWGVLAALLVVAAGALLDVDRLTPFVAFVAVLLVPAAMTVAVVNPSLVSIEDLLGRTLVYGALAVTLLVVDLAVVAGLTLVLGDALDQRQVIVVALLLSVTLYGPLRARLAAAVRRRVLGQRGAPYDVMAGLAATLETADQGEGELAAVARAVARAFGVGYVSVEVERGGGERLVTTYGVPPERTRSLPIAYRGAEVGRLVLPARGMRSRLSGRDERLLADLVRQAAIVARTGRLAEELQESRERLVVAREEERRRIRRDLHDGLGPALSGMVFRLESARLLVERDPASAKAQIAATSGHVQEVVADVRRLVHDLRPPALDDLGLVGALRQQAETVTAAGGPRVTLRADGLERGALSAATEVAAYRIVGEALTNVVRHSLATRAEVALERDGGGLTVSVRDDGVGIPDRAQAGVGLVSLRERAAELGGRVEVTCPAGGGTLVQARLPLPRPLDDGSPA